MEVGSSSRNRRCLPSVGPRLTPIRLVRRCALPIVLPPGEIQRRDKHVDPAMQGLRTAVRLRPPPPILEPQLLPVGAFSCLFAPVPACCWGFLRKPADFASRPNWPLGPHSTLSWPFLAPTSLPETGPKSAKSAKTASHAHTDQRVTRGRIKRLDCSMGWRRKRCRCVPSVVIDPYRRIATGMGCTWMADGRGRLSGHRPDNYNKSIQDQSGRAPRAP